MSSAHLESTDAVEALRAAVIRYREEALSTLGRAQVAVHQVLEWLYKQLRHWQSEHEHWTAEVSRTQWAYEACLRSGDKDNRPSCRAEETALLSALHYQAVTGAALQTAKSWIATVGQTFERDYSSAASHLRTLLDNDVERAIVELAREVEVVKDREDQGFRQRGAISFGSPGVSAASRPDPAPWTPAASHPSSEASGSLEKESTPEVIEDGSRSPELGG